MAWKLKLDDKGQVVYDGDKPVFIKDDGSEIPFDPQQAFNKIGQLTGEAASNRKRGDELEGKLKQYEGIEDPEAARKALELASNIDQKKLLDAGKVEEVKQAALAAAKAQYEGQLNATKQQAEKYQKDLETVTGQLHETMIGGGFDRSKFIGEKIAVPPDMVRATFGRAFKIEEGKVVAYGSDGKPIYSKSRMGELADFDEAIETLVQAYPHKDKILKASGASGSGATNGAGTSANGRRTIPRSQYDAFPPDQQRQAAIDVAQGKAVLTD